MITLNAKQAIGQVVVSDIEQQDKNDLAYYRARYAGKTFIIRENVYADLKAGHVYELNLQETTYTSVDSEGNETPNTPGLEYAGHITGTQMIGVTKTDVAIKVQERTLLATAPRVESVEELA